MVTLQQLRAKAAACFREAADSFERSDTDGFVTQWASNLNGQLYERQAEIAEAGGVAEFWGLFDLEGRRLPAKLIDGKHGPCWAMMTGPGGKFTGQFIPFCDSAADRWGYESGGQACQEFDEESGCWRIDEGANEIACELAKVREERWVKRHGVRQLREMAPAVARMAGSGKGLSGSAWVAVFRTDGL